MSEPALTSCPRCSAAVDSADQSKHQEWHDNPARELADVVYVAYGTAHSLGIPLDAVIAEVHRANMSKMGPDGPLIDGGGKVLKGPHFRPPDVAALLSTPCPHGCAGGHASFYDYEDQHHNPGR